ncbi:putative HVA22-like protein g [Hirschfeldia incana]|nr:putative HVA22-like protein g [Hirschfeldia incana]
MRRGRRRRRTTSGFWLLLLSLSYLSPPFSFSLFNALKRKRRRAHRSSREISISFLTVYLRGGYNDWIVSDKRPFNKPEILQLQFWCQYWILVAALTVFERVGDTFVSWLPMYSEAKLAFFIYLWFPKTKGTTYVYDSFFKPYVSKHENEIDRSLTEVKTRAGDMAMIYLHKAINHGHTRFFEILQYIAEQSSPKRQSKEEKETTTAELGDPTLKMTQNKDTVPEIESSTKKA